MAESGDTFISSARRACGLSRVMLTRVPSSSAMTVSSLPASARVPLREPRVALIRIVGLAGPVVLPPSVRPGCGAVLRSGLHKIAVYKVG